MLSISQIWETCLDSAEICVSEMSINERESEAKRLRCKDDDLVHSLAVEFYETWEEAFDEN